MRLTIPNISAIFSTLSLEGDSNGEAVEPIPLKKRSHDNGEQ